MDPYFPKDPPPPGVVFSSSWYAGREGTIWNSSRRELHSLETTTELVVSCVHDNPSFSCCRYISVSSYMLVQEWPGGHRGLPIDGCTMDTSAMQGKCSGDVAQTLVQLHWCKGQNGIQARWESTYTLTEASIGQQRWPQLWKNAMPMTELAQVE